MSPLVRRAQRVVETHLDVADEEAAGVGHFQSAGLLLHEAVGGKRCEQAEFLYPPRQKNKFLLCKRARIFSFY